MNWGAIAQVSQIAFLTVQEFSAACLSAPNPDAITVPFTKILRDAEILSWFVGSLANVDKERRPGFGYYGIPSGWKDVYEDACYFNHDPVFQHAQTGHQPIVWSACKQQASLTKTAMKIFAEAAEYDLTDGYIMPVRGFGDLPGAVTFGGLDPDLSIESRMTLFMLGAYAYEGLRRLNEKFRQLPAILTKRELEVLRWSAEGKSAWDIGVILKIGETTVRTHQASIRRKYGVPSIIQAAVLAAWDGTLRFGMSLSTHQV